MRRRRDAEVEAIEVTDEASDEASDEQLLPTCWAPANATHVPETLVRHQFSVRIEQNSPVVTDLYVYVYILVHI